MRTNLAANDAAFSCVYEQEDEEGHRGVKLSKDLMSIAGGWWVGVWWCAGAWVCSGEGGLEEQEGDGRGQKGVAIRGCQEVPCS